MSAFKFTKCSIEFQFLAAVLKICLAMAAGALIDVSGIIEKFNVYVNLAIIPRTKEINKSF